jgi:diacylglycerol O-acyltransferase / wax synthase
LSEHLTALDATFLELEEADESAHMHIGAIMVFDPPPDGEPPSRDQLCRYLSHRLGQLPRYRQRLSEPHTGGMRWPEWQQDPAFDIGRHLARAALPRPGGREELLEWSSNFFSQRLDRHRPLWEMVVVEGLAGGRWALASKTHHCMVDGIGSVDVGHLLLDVKPQPADALELPEVPPSAHSADLASTPAPHGPLARLARAWAGILPGETILHAAQAGAHGMLHPRDALSSARAALRMIVAEELHAAPHTSLNEKIGTLRRFEVVDVPLAELKEIKNTLGGTVNDVALAVTASGLRELLHSRGETLPPPGLRAMVPMNVRAASEHLTLGNKVTSLFVELPVAARDPIVRYRETVARTSALKSGGEQAGTSAVIELTSLAPPVIHATLAQALYATRLFNVTITNVPGPQQTLYAFEAPLREIYPLVPLAAEHSVGVALVSYDGSMFIGVVADGDTVPDLPVMLEAMRDSLQQLLSTARRRARSGAGVGAAAPRRSRRRAATG